MKRIWILCKCIISDQPTMAKTVVEWIHNFLLALYAVTFIQSCMLHSVFYSDKHKSKTSSLC